MMPMVSRDAGIDRLIASNAVVAIGVSGGKDSQAAAIATKAHLDAMGHSGPVVLIHSDLGVVEWDQSLPVCTGLAERLKVELIVVRRKSGDLMDRWEARWASSRRRYEELSTVTLVPCWSTPAMRFCTSELKTHVIAAELKRRFPGQSVINVTGVRREESAARAKVSIAQADADGRTWHWRPIADWRLADVWSCIAAAGLTPHEAYAGFGMSRVSCRFCIMSSGVDLEMAASQLEAAGLYRRMVRLEATSSFAFQGARWLGDVRPGLLSPDERARFERAKHLASRRVAIEARVTKPMRYVAGWPTRMLTDDEADVLADVRSEVSDLMGFQSQHLTRDSIHTRYAGLIAARNEKAAA